MHDAAYYPLRLVNVLQEAENLGPLKAVEDRRSPACRLACFRVAACCPAAAVGGLAISLSAPALQR
jgi:hypothetical protein